MESRKNLCNYRTVCKETYNFLAQILSSNQSDMKTTIYFKDCKIFSKDNGISFFFFFWWVQNLDFSKRILFSRLNFCDEAWWFLSLSVFGLLSSSLLLFPQRFGRYVLQPSSDVCRTRKPSRNFELCPLLNPRGSPVLIPLAITGYRC